MGAPVSFREALGVWARIGCLSFGGPAGQIALMHRVLVEEKRWIGEARFLHALNYCMLLPGPEAQQLATYVGWLLFGTRGGLAAGLLFILPGVLCVGALGALYVAGQDVSLVAALFFGLKAAVLAVVIEAVLRIGRKVLKNPLTVALAALSFVAIFLLGVPFPWIVLGAGLFGLVASRAWPGLFPVVAHAASAGGSLPAAEVALESGAARLRPSPGRTLRTLALWLGVWLGPFLALAWARGLRDPFVEAARFFSQTAVVTFGGAYAVLGYVAQHAVEQQGWLTPGEMLDGLGLAETTPGPLILVLEFVGTLAGHRAPGAVPWIGALCGALVAVWFTFAPCFLWIFVGAPYVEALRGNRRLDAALSSITAAVVGVILNLAVWFGLHVLFARVAESRWHGLRLFVPDPASLDLRALALGALAAWLLFRTRLGMLRTLGVCALLGGLLWMLPGPR